MTTDSKEVINDVNVWYELYEFAKGKIIDGGTIEWEDFKGGCELFAITKIELD